MSWRMRRRVSSVAFAALPTMTSAFATSLRSVLAVTPSQKMLMPPTTMGIEAESVVFICIGFWPALGFVQAFPPVQKQNDVRTRHHSETAQATRRGIAEEGKGYRNSDQGPER
eukprot:3936886-Rhodomonas_salina.1